MDSSASVHPADRDDRFRFGRNWQRFLSVLNDERITIAQQSVRSLLQVEDLRGLRLLDIGSGSGLFSLAARRLGAQVTSFDFDPDSVACTEEVRRRYAPDDSGWTVLRGSVLDADFLQSLGTFDVVYSWGVLHHTGDMWQAFERVSSMVKPGGQLAISIYNDQGGGSRRWKVIKRWYNRTPAILRPFFATAVLLPRELRFFAADLLKACPLNYFRNVMNYAANSNRGMSYLHDLVDWIGGYPFEVAKPEDVFSFFRDRGFRLEGLTTVAGGNGCNEFLFRFDLSSVRSRAESSDADSSASSASTKQ